MPTPLDLLASYVPPPVVRHCLRRLSAGGSQAQTVQAEQFAAAVLFADISGFTPLTETLAQRGPEGVEELTRLLNTYFGELIDTITAHGGEVVKFAGDALLALWLTEAENAPTPAEALRLAARRAAQCSQAIQARLHNFHAADQIRLSLRIGLSAGPTITAHLGGLLGRWEFLVAGPAVTQASLACTRAAPGQNMVDRATWALLHEDPTGLTPHADIVPVPEVAYALPLQSPPTAPPLFPSLAEALYPYLPTALRERLAAGQMRWMAELRRVTVLFIHLPDLTHTIQPAHAQAITQSLQKALYHYEGSINQLTVDEKGVTLLAALGLPPLAHVDDAARGVQAALDMVAALATLEVPSRVGLTTGRAFCGTVGNDTRRVYTLLGDPVNLAARLMQTTAQVDEAILCDAATYQAAHAAFEFEALPPVRVKGKAEPVALYAPRGKKSAAAHAPAIFVGRAAERGQLRAALGAVRAGDNLTLVVEGEAGIGKSRLAAELQAQAATLGMRCVLGWADAVERNAAYHAWRPIFSQLLEAETLPADPAARRAEVAQRLQAHAPQVDLALLPLLNAVLPFDWPETAQTQPLQGEGRANKTNDWLSQLLQAYTAGQPLVLVLEDAHWLDSASWALARFVSLDVRPLLLALITRPMPEPLPPEYRYFLAQPQRIHLRLEQLGPEEIQQLICARLGVTALPAAVAHFIQERGEGHPFFSEELAYALRDAGLIRVEGAVCRLGANVDLKTVSFPDTVQGVIASRIDRLPPQQQFTLKVASVIGRVFALQVLEAVHPIEADKAQLTGYVAQLAQLDITPLETPEPELAYIFKHIITQEVAYELMLFSQRRQLHQAVAEWYERTYTADLAPYYPLLAHHWRKAEALDKAAHYLALAGQRALRNGVYLEAIDFFAERLTLEPRLQPPPTPAQRAEGLYQLGDAYYGVGQIEPCWQYTVQALGLLGFSYPTARPRLIFSLLRELARQFWHRRFGPPAAPPEAAPALVAVALAYQRLIQINYTHGDVLGTAYTILRQLNLAETAGPAARPQQTQGFGSMTMVAQALHQRTLTQFYADHAEAAAQQTVDPNARAWVHYVVGTYYLNFADWARSNAMLTAGQQFALQAGNVRRWEEITSHYITGLHIQGDLAGALAQAAQLQQVATRQSDQQMLFKSLFFQARTALRQRRLAAAHTWAQQAAALIADQPDQANLQVLLGGVWVLLHHTRGNFTEAEAAAQRLTALFKQVDPLWWIDSLDIYQALCDYHLGQWAAQPSPAAQQAARHSLRALQRYAQTLHFGDPSARLREGWAQHLAAQPAALRTLTRGLALAQQMHMPYEEATAHDYLSRLLPANDPARETHVEKAKAIWARLGVEGA